jgi:hypothetical protein
MRAGAGPCPGVAVFQPSTAIAPAAPCNAGVVSVTSTVQVDGLGGVGRPHARGEVGRAALLRAAKAHPVLAPGRVARHGHAHQRLLEAVALAPQPELSAREGLGEDGVPAAARRGAGQVAAVLTHVEAHALSPRIIHREAERDLDVARGPAG